VNHSSPIRSKIHGQHAWHNHSSTDPVCLHLGYKACHVNTWFQINCTYNGHTIQSRVLYFRKDGNSAVWYVGTAVPEGGMSVDCAGCSGAVEVEAVASRVWLVAYLASFLVDCRYLHLAGASRVNSPIAVVASLRQLWDRPVCVWVVCSCDVCGVVGRCGVTLWCDESSCHVTRGGSVFIRFFTINWPTFFLINETGKAFASCFDKKKNRATHCVQVVSSRHCTQ
jgi:hypothetical protein